MSAKEPWKAPRIAAPVDDSPVFSCKMCGQCCRGVGGIVVSPSDLSRLAWTLRMSERQVVERYGETRGGKLQIRAGEDGACVFFREGRGCSVHRGKPDVCRAWPFFRGNIVDPASLAMAKDYCPGIAKDCTHAAFAREGRVYLSRHGLLAHDRDSEGRAVNLDDSAAGLSGPFPGVNGMGRPGISPGPFLRPFRPFPRFFREKPGLGNVRR